jgi:cytochrome c1
MLNIVDSIRDGSAFPCHKTSGDPYPKWRACAGWLLYQYKRKNSNAQLQIMERAKLYRPRRLINDGDMIITRQEIEDADWFR